jgi:hypothetical protein
LELEERLRWALEARVPVAAARDPERLRAELEAAAGLLRAADAFELLRAEPELDPLRAAAFELVRAAELDLLRAEPELALRRLELAAVAPLPPAAWRLRSPVFGEALRFVLVCLATCLHSTAGVNEAGVHATSIAAGTHIDDAAGRPVGTRRP